MTECTTRPTRILLIKQTIAADFFMTEAAKDLARRFPNVTLLSSLYPVGRAGRKRDLESPGLDVRLTGWPYSNRNLCSRLISWMIFGLSASWAILTSSRHTLVVMVCQPPFLPIAAWLGRKLCGRPYILWIDDLYPDAVEAQRLAGSSHPVVRAWRVLNRLSFSAASAVITLGPAMAKRAGAYLKTSPHPSAAPEIHCLPTWADHRRLYPLPPEQNTWRHELRLADKTVILFTGNLGLSHGLETLAQAADRLPASSNAHFVIIGQGPGLDGLKKAAEHSGRFTFLPYQPADRFNAALNLGDLAVVSLAEGFEGVSMPSKTYSVMAAGCAVLGISRAPSDISALIETHQCGVHVPFGDPDQLAQAITDAEQHPEELSQWKQASRTAAEGPLSREVSLERFAKIIANHLPAK